DEAVRKAEYECKPAVELYPKAGFSKSMRELAKLLVGLDAKKLKVPEPLTDEDFHRLSRRGFEGKRMPPPVPVHAPTGTPSGKARIAAKELKLEQPDDRLERALALWAKSAPGGGGWVDGPHAMQWGEKDQWRSFFCDLEAWRNIDQQSYLDSPIVNVTHEDLECHYSTPYFDDGLMSWGNYTWSARWPVAKRRTTDYVALTTDIREADVVGGGKAKLDAAMEQALKQTEGKAAILVTTTCVPTVIGDDTVGILEKYRGRSKVPLLLANAAAGFYENPIISLFRGIKKRAEFKQARPRSRTVNLVGFPPGRALEELERLLGQAGVHVNLRMLPRFSVEEADRFLAAEAHVFYPDPAYAELYEKLFSDLELKRLSPVAPYGLENTRRWVMEVARSLAAEESAKEMWSRESKRVAGPWELLRARVKGKRVAFIADPARVKRLADPGGLSGVPLVSMLKEMGFGIDYLIYAEQKPELPKEKGKHSVSWFTSKEELNDLITHGAFDAVYTEYFFDTRVTRAGKVPFSLLDAEMGTGGCLRSLDRLARLCDWKSYRRYLYPVS
ncbi:MAG: nitrogenase component 1, partial [Elusimicrobiota bacterium]